MDIKCDFVDEEQKKDYARGLQQGFTFYLIRHKDIDETTEIYAKVLKSTIERIISYQIVCVILPRSCYHKNRLL
jgi:hypothetical protein